MHTQEIDRVCVLCGDPERSIYANDLCRSCYNLKCSIKQLELKKRRTPLASQRIWFQSGLEPKLEEFKRRERFHKIYWQRKHPVEGSDLEFLLERTARRLFRKKYQDCFFGRAIMFDHNFSKKQRRILYKIIGLLDDPMRLKRRSDFQI